MSANDLEKTKLEIFLLHNFADYDVYSDYRRKVWYYSPLSVIQGLMILPFKIIIGILTKLNFKVRAK